MQLITARRLIDGTGAPPLDWPAVVVDDTGHLAYVGPRAALGPSPADLQTYPLGEVTLLPGIVDAHVHLTFDGGPDPLQTLLATDDSVLYDQMVARAAQMVR